MNEETINKLINRCIAKTLEQIETNHPRCTKDIIKKRLRLLEKDLNLLNIKR